MTEIQLLHQSQGSNQWGPNLYAPVTIAPVSKGKWYSEVT